MKQVVTELPPKNIVSVNCVSKKKFYGVTHKGDEKWKGFISLDHYTGDLFGPASVRCLDLFTIGNRYGHSSTKGIQDLIEMMIKCGYVVYEFDKLSEMAIWLES
jgi:hypothetical protein